MANYVESLITIHIIDVGLRPLHILRAFLTFCRNLIFTALLWNSFAMVCSLKFINGAVHVRMEKKLLTSKKDKR